AGMLFHVGAQHRAQCAAAALLGRQAGWSPTPGRDQQCGPTLGRSSLASALSRQTRSRQVRSAQSRDLRRPMPPRPVGGVTDLLDRCDGRLPKAVAAELARLRAENTRLLRMLDLTPEQAALPGPAQTGYFEAPPGPVHNGSAPEEKVAFFSALFAARTDIY